MEQHLQHYLKLTKADEFINTGNAYAGLYYNKGYIGMFYAKDKSSGKALLNKCLDRLASLGKKQIIAPIDGSTWFNYRLVSWDSRLPAFPLEPHNPIWYNDIFLDSGFTPFEIYYSDIFPLENLRETKNENPEVHIRNVNLNNISSEMEMIYKLSLSQFNKNYLYDDISYEQFNNLYRPKILNTDLNFVKIAELNGNAIGFLFAYPQETDKIILKTIAIDENFRRSGIAGHLFNNVLLKAKNNNFKSAVAALYHKDNPSGRISAKYNGKRLREYTLYKF